MKDVDESVDFLKSLWPAEIQGYFNIWSKENGTIWFAATHEQFSVAALKSHDLAKITNVYYSVSLQKHKLDRYHRGLETGVIALPGIWVDMDIETDKIEHEKGPYPPSREAAQQLCEQLFSPTLYVDSGYGYHAYWLFEEPWELSNKLDRQEAMGTTRGWQAQIKRNAKEKGWIIDPTADLVRILRLPGTRNHKERLQPYDDGTTPLVRLIEGSGKRYQPSDFEPYIIDPTVPLIISEKIEELKFVEDGSVPTAKFSAFLQDKKVKATWERKRTDINDTSPSGWDMALATLALLHGFTEQETLYILISSRKQHKDNLKMDNKQYYLRTIAKAKETVERDRSLANMSTPNTNTVTTSRDTVLHDLEAALGFRVDRLVKYPSDESVYKLFTDHGDFELGPIGNITHFDRFRDKIADTVYIVFPDQLRRNWTNVAQQLMNIVEIADIGDAATERVVIIDLIRGYAEYLAATEYETKKDAEDAIKLERPFYHKGYLYISTLGDRGFGKFIQTRRAKSRDAEKIAGRFAVFDFAKTSETYFEDKEQKTKTYWKIPVSVLE